MSQEYTMIFEQHLDAEGNVMETTAVHPKRLEDQQKAREGQTYQPSKMPPKDMVYVKGERTADGEFIVKSISRSGTTSTKLAQNLYGDAPEMNEFSSDEKEALFGAYSSPEQVEIEGRTFTKGGPLSGEITNLEKAGTQETIKLFSQAEGNMGVSLHMDHNTQEALRQSEMQKRIARNAEAEQGQAVDKSIRFGLSAKGQYFSEVVDRDAAPLEGAHTVTLSFQDNEVGQPVISEIKLDGKNFEMQAQRYDADVDLEEALRPENVSVFSLNMQTGNTMHEAYVVNAELERMGPEGEAMIAGVKASYQELSAEKVRTLEEHGKDLARAQARVAERADQGFEMGR